MEKIRACKTLLLYSLIAVLEFSVVFAVGFWRGYSHAGRSGGDSEGAERYEKRNASASESVGRIEDGICRIEQIIFKAEEENGVLADGYDCIDPGGGN
ncbi:MAG: hypothetical protein IJJ71_12195 [Treponema sp.]|uniref:hypothetical protein n=1 Tax=Treponema sp. TaxID=166 RepID=UPI0025FB6DD7|nr:hypothetical protein [Treponema sp.]MBQ7538607.1 hypothetical protein [Treponema sp.]MBR0496924.1 hypothetical protein [Treponema sp.]